MSGEQNTYASVLKVVTLTPVQDLMTNTELKLIKRHVSEKMLLLIIHTQLDTRNALKSHATTHNPYLNPHILSLINILLLIIKFKFIIKNKELF